MNAKGYVLIELLIATALLSAAGTQFYTGLVQGVRAANQIRNIQRDHWPFRIFSMRIEHDLRNSIPLRQYAFEGKEKEMSFPVYERRLEQGKAMPRLYLVRYFLREGSLICSRQEISNRLLREPEKETVILKRIKGFKFSYSFLDEEEQAAFESFWSEKPYFGIPRAVKIELNFMESSKKFEKIVSILQGKWAREISF